MVYLDYDRVCNFINYKYKLLNNYLKMKYYLFL